MLGEGGEHWIGELRAEHKAVGPEGGGQQTGAKTIRVQGRSQALYGLLPCPLLAMQGQWQLQVHSVTVGQHDRWTQG